MAVTASLPASARGSFKCECMIPPVVARRIISCLLSLCKASPRVAFSMLIRAEDCDDKSCLDKVFSIPLNFLLCIFDRSKNDLFDSY